MSSNYNIERNGEPNTSTLLLSTVPLFSGLSDNALVHLAGITSRRHVRRKQAIVSHGEQTTTLYVIISGSAKVSNSNSDGQEVIISILHPRSFFGEMALLDSGPCSANVIALEPTELLVLPKPEFLSCLQSYPNMAQQLILSLVSRLREADRKIESLALLDVRGRVISLLNEMAIEEDGKKIIRQKIPKQNISKMVGASREMVSRVMRGLEDEGIIHTESDHVIIQAS